jgi:hypothetical protein
MWTLLSVISNGTDLVFYRRRGAQEGKQFRFLLGDKVSKVRWVVSSVSADDFRGSARYSDARRSFPASLPYLKPDWSWLPNDICFPGPIPNQRDDTVDECCDNRVWHIAERSCIRLSPRRLIETAFALDQGRNGHAGFNGRIMPIGFVFRCPNTGLNVQGWVAENPSEPESEAYEAVTCTACARVHLVDPRTGKILGSKDD